MFGLGLKKRVEALEATLNDVNNEALFYYQKQYTELKDSKRKEAVNIILSKECRRTYGFVGLSSSYYGKKLYVSKCLSILATYYTAELDGFSFDVDTAKELYNLCQTVEDAKYGR